MCAFSQFAEKENELLGYDFWQDDPQLNGPHRGTLATVYVPEHKRWYALCGRCADIVIEEVGAYFYIAKNS